MNEVVIRPSLVSMLRWGFQVMGTAMVMIVLIALVGDLVSGNRPRLLDMDLATGALLMIGFPAGAGLIGFCVIAFPWTARATPRGLRGRSTRWRTMEIAWKDIGEILAIPVEGIPSLQVQCKRSGRTLLIYTMGLKDDARAVLDRMIAAARD